MTKKLPFKQNSAGKWINTKTGRFASKVEYQPYAEKQAKANLARSASSKEYWNDVKSVKNLFGITDTKEARKKLYSSPKYVEKRGKKARQFTDFWKELKKAGLNTNKEAVKQKKQKLEDEGFELISF
jgi:hypothetical protein